MSMPGSIRQPGMFFVQQDGKMRAVRRVRCDTISQNPIIGTNRLRQQGWAHFSFYSVPENPGVATSVGSIRSKGWIVPIRRR
jgi:hypothetical protein